MARGLMLGYENSEFHVIVLILCPILGGGGTSASFVLGCVATGLEN